MLITATGNTIQGAAAATITARQALKFAESGSDGLFTPCTADTDKCLGWALNDANTGEQVLVQVDGIPSFLAGGGLDASSNAGAFLTCGLAGKMYLAGAAKLHWLQWAPNGPSQTTTNCDVAIGGIGFGLVARGTTAA